MACNDSEPMRPTALVVLLDDLEAWITERVTELDAGDMTTDEDMAQMRVYADLRAWSDAHEAPADPLPGQGA